MRFTLLPLLLLLAGCAHSQPPALIRPQVEWEFERGSPSAAREAMRCTLSARLPDGTHVAITDSSGGLMLGIARPGQVFGALSPASVTLTSIGGTLVLPARALNGGVLLAPLSDAADPQRQLLTVISKPFQVTARVGTATVVQEDLLSVMSAAGREHALCLASLPAGSR